MIAVLGAGAFGTALALALARDGRSVTLWARDAATFGEGGSRRLAGHPFPAGLVATTDLSVATAAQTILLAVPAQALARFLADHAPQLRGRLLVACCKGIDQASGLGPVATILAQTPDAQAALLTGPGFAGDIAAGLPTAMTLACADDAAGREAQRLLSTPRLRLYRTTDTTGAELGGALKNVVAIAAGLVIGAGLGESARAALITRGHAEMLRLAVAMGARPETLAGLSGFGDLVLTCTSARSRNYAYGEAIGAGRAPATGQTVEGVATARAVTRLAGQLGIDMPVAAMVAALIDRDITLDQAVAGLLSRPLKEE